ncbi:hypothetical protein RFI_21757 [Reticulomyxa filosa]|uniref:methionine adenosyltransferase n=1 Tax=Reticulomyxa filosa TaxID=46433 RepID=X6MR75_RETFI|nr:hypothetical protein RFI_21757 [Reticulomyxa filosa]|eukprot:ETO15605.1 hypothetical protein RFI_21757 [Reticulomyxa filosa]
MLLGVTFYCLFVFLIYIYIMNKIKYTKKRPDGKTQVTMVYKQINGAMIPQRIHTLLISCQHEDGVNNEQIRRELMEDVVKHTIPSKFLTQQTIYHLNPSGRFVIGGPHGDAGLTGRKIIVDTYGGWGAHGGGAFSGKDPSKVDRCGAYASRWIAKSLVSNKLCSRCLVQLSYAIDFFLTLICVYLKKKKHQIFVETYGTNTRPLQEIYKIIKDNFNLRPGVIIRELKLRRPIYSETAAYGHFGRLQFTWEQPKQLILKND